jgi:serine phosphatase RsbU (regulator of sigma subunit)
MAELGGDYPDFFAVSDEECGVLLGDVAGHGVGAALGALKRQSLMR